MEFKNSTNEKQRPKFTTSTPVYSIKRLYHKMAEYITTVGDSLSFENENTNSPFNNNVISDDKLQEIVTSENLNIDLNTDYDQSVNKSKIFYSEEMNTTPESKILRDKFVFFDKSSILFKSQTESSFNSLENCDLESCMKNYSTDTKSIENSIIDPEKDSKFNTSVKFSDVSKQVKKQDESESALLVCYNDESLIDINSKSSIENKAKELKDCAGNPEFKIDYSFIDNQKKFSNTRESLKENKVKADIDSATLTRHEDIDSLNDESICSSNVDETTKPSKETYKFDIDDDEEFLFSDNLNENCSTPDSLEESLLMADSSSSTGFKDLTSSDIKKQTENSKNCNMDVTHSFSDPLRSHESTPFLLKNILSSESNHSNSFSYFGDSPSNNKNQCLQKENNSAEPEKQGENHNKDVDYLSSDNKHSLCNSPYLLKDNALIADEGSKTDNKNNCIQTAKEDTVKPLVDDDYIFSDILNEFGSTPDLPEENLIEPDLGSPNFLRNPAQNSARSNSLYEYNDSSSSDNSQYKSFEDLSSFKHLSVPRSHSLKNCSKDLDFSNFQWNVSENVNNTLVKVKNCENILESTYQNDNDNCDDITPVFNKTLYDTDIDELNGNEIYKIPSNIEDKSVNCRSIINAESVLNDDENANSPKEQLFRFSVTEKKTSSERKLALEDFLKNNHVLKSRLKINPNEFHNEVNPKMQNKDFIETGNQLNKYEYPVSPIEIESESSKETSEFFESVFQKETLKEHIFNEVTSNIFDHSDKEFVMEVEDENRKLSKFVEDNSSVTDNEMNTNSSDVELITPPETNSPLEQMETDVFDPQPGSSNGNISESSFNLVSYRNMLKKHFTSKIALEKAVKRALLKANNKTKGLTLKQILKYISQNKLLNAHSKLDRDIQNYLEEAQNRNYLKCVRNKYIILNQKKKTRFIENNNQVLQNETPNSLHKKTSYLLRSKTPYSLRSKANRKNLKRKGLKKPKLNKSSKKTPQKQIRNKKKTPKSTQGSVFKKLRTRTVLKKK